MPEVVKVSSIETNQELMSSVEQYFKKGRYTEITQAIGLHSILIDPQYTRKDQDRLYRSVLNMIKNEIADNLGKKYAGWYSDFPKVMDEIVTGEQIVTDKVSSEMLSSHRAAYGPFKSADDFFFWALDDRRLTLDQVVKYFKKTAELHCR
jgi:hypothetical protein